MPVTRLSTLSILERSGTATGSECSESHQHATSPVPKRAQLLPPPAVRLRSPGLTARRSPRRPPPTGHLIALAMHRTGMLIPHSKVPDLTQIGGRCCLTVGIVPPTRHPPVGRGDRKDANHPTPKKTILLSPPGTGGEAPQHTISPDCLSAQL